MFARTKAAKLFTTIAEAAGISKANSDVEGPALASSFSIGMGGQLETAARYVRQILEAQKVSKTEWKKYSITDAGGSAVAAYINPDKNNETIKGKIGLRRVFTIRKRLHPDVKFNQSKLSLQASIEWASLVKVDIVVSQNESSLQWNAGVASRHKIRQADVESDFNSDLGEDVPKVCHGEELSVGFWNARALLHHKPQLRKDKLQLVFTQARRHSVYFVAECHGTEELVTHSLHHLPEVFEYHLDSCETYSNPDPSSGCLLVLVNKAHYQGWCRDYHSYSPGRLGISEAWTASSVSGKVATCCAGGVHYFGIRREELLEFRDAMVEASRIAKADPIP